MTRKKTHDYLGIRMAKCPVCGKIFPVAAQHAYRDHNGTLVCSYHCTLADERAHEAKTANGEKINADTTLVITGHWLDMILSGGKREEYREIKKYYTSRFSHLFGEITDKESEQTARIRLREGYNQAARSVVATCTIRIGEGKPEWGAEAGRQYYVLGIKEIEEENI